MAQEMNFDDLFGGMGGDLFADFGTPVKKEEKKAEKKAESKAPAKKESKAQAKDTKAASTKMHLPVTVYGRNFALNLDGDGQEVSVQQLIEKLVSDGHFDELKHKNVKFAVKDEHTLIVVYELKNSGDDIAVTLPVTVCDGGLKAEFSENTQFELDEDDEPSVADLVKAGLADEDRAGMMMDYDPSSGIALPLYKELPAKDAAKELKAGDRVLVLGQVKTVENASSVIPDLLGEIPADWGTEWKKLTDGFYSLVLKPVKGKAVADLIRADRSVWGIKEEVKAEVKKEMINLPVTVETICPKVSVTFESSDFDGAAKVSFEDIDKKLHSSFPVIGQRNPSDHIYQPDKNLLEVSYTSGRKG